MSEGQASSFETQLEELEAIVAQLEDESVGLERSLELFERGMTLAGSCQQRLAGISARVEELVAAADGSVSREPLEVATTSSTVEPAASAATEDDEDVPF